MKKFFLFIALGMFLETQFGRYPENGFSVVCAYLFGWAYICFTMIPIGSIYLLKNKMGLLYGMQLTTKDYM